MSLFDRFKSFLKPGDEVDVTPDKKLQERSAAWSYATSLYSQKDFQRYNPDDLIGRKGYDIYRKMMRDEQVKAVVRFKRDAITSRDFYFELSTDELGDEEIARRIAIAKKAVENITGSFTDALNNIMSAIYNGYSMTEKLFELFSYDSAQYWGIKELRLKPYDTFYFHVDDFGNLTKITQKGPSRELEIDRESFIHYVVNPDVDPFYGQSELREAYRAYFGKDMVIKFWNIWLERHAGGVRWIQPTEGSDKQLSPGSAEYTALQSMLSNVQTATGFIIPKGLEFETSYPTNNVAYKEAIAERNKEISKALLVPNLLGISEQGDVGSYSQSSTQLETFLWTLNADSMRLEDALNEQLFWPLGLINFGDDLYPKIKFKSISETKKYELLKTWRELVSGNAVEASDTDEDHIRELLDFPEKGTPRPKPALPGLLPGQQPAAQGSPATAPVKDKEPPDKKPELPDETITGQQVKARLQQAMKRVDFAVLARRSDILANDGAQVLGVAAGELTRELLGRLPVVDDLNEIAESIPKLKLDSKLMNKFQRSVSKILSNGWELGLRHAKDEIDKAKQERFSKRHDRERVTMIGEELFDLKSFTITGKFTDDALNTIKQLLINGAKNGKSTDQVIEEIYTRFAQDGMIDKEFVEQALGHSLDVTNPQARLETIVRTNTFEAINEARYAYFTDPALGGFVEALEYSAILDSRTTEICEELDGHVHPADDDFWTTYSPPNHFNCRSILIPVTQLDTWTASDGDVGTQPQKGFA